MDQQDLEALSAAGRKCEFCGKNASSGYVDARKAVYWCRECGLDLDRVLVELYSTRTNPHQPDMMEKALETLKERRLRGRGN